jgi:hypothetical protein
VAYPKPQTPEQGIKSCLAILHLTKQYGNARVEAACQKALLLKRPHRTVVVNLLNNHKELAHQPAEQDESSVTHHNIRGQHYYQ